MENKFQISALIKLHIKYGDLLKHVPGGPFFDQVLIMANVRNIVMKIRMVGMFAHLHFESIEPILRRNISIFLIQDQCFYNSVISLQIFSVQSQR